MDPNGRFDDLRCLVPPVPIVAREMRAVADEPGRAVRSGTPWPSDPWGVAGARRRRSRSTGPSRRIQPAPRGGCIFGRAAGHRPGGVRERRR